MAASKKSLLIIFYRNPKPGFVKTRLAATIGDDKAMAIYNRLAHHTREITEGLALDKIVYYSEHIDAGDTWPNDLYLKAIQEGNDLGDRMANAFTEGFRKGYERICIIGTDCLELTSDIISQAYAELQTSDAVIGPALDGGYYLLGMRKFHRNLFLNKQWSTDNIMHETMKDFQLLGLTCTKLPALRDVDTEDDLPDSWK
jgi:rSAM/selenodomain-associated transferase 1